MTVLTKLGAAVAAVLCCSASVGLAAVPAAPAARSASATMSGSAGAASTAAPPSHVPVFAYFYQWFNPSSWDRAKQDLPLAGKYSSDDPHVLRDQIEAARAAGIDGFLTSWKSTATLNRRLDLLISVARSEQLDLGVVYEALDFSRRPLPVETVKHDMLYLVTSRSAGLKSTYYGRPVIIWTGTDQYSAADVRSVRAAIGDRAYLLAASKQVADYERIADTVDGEAYYWSSADPDNPATPAKLEAMGKAVHAHGGLWIAPAASGYDGRTLGGSRVIDRKDGQTLVHSLSNALATSPDCVGLISWNEWSENTYIEPGHKYGDQEITVLRNYLLQRASGAPVRGSGADSSEGESSSTWTGARAALTLVVFTAAGALVLLAKERRKRRVRPAHGQPERL
jgi:hypothetical protein